MDEMAEKLGLDPVEFRIRNDTQLDPEHPERPFSQRQLVECLSLGVERFGWQRRNKTPARYVTATGSSGSEWRARSGTVVCENRGPGCGWIEGAS